MVACNANYENRAFLVAILYQDPVTGETSLHGDIDAYTKDVFQNMTKDEFMAEFEVFQAVQKHKH